ncbi:MAG: hypothetical protein GXP40_11915 [Chloroflexi bacterium]|nr:hypothetical protein [Chloroflexota bacterium]
MLTYNAWTLRVRRARDIPARLLLLLHGWTGDERSMWGFVRHFSQDYWILAPRAPHPAEEGGYSWRELKPGTWGVPTFDELRPAADALVSFLDEWSASVSVDVSRFDVIGFSQGGALANTLSMLYPHRVRKVGVLAGFVPPGVDGWVSRQPLKGIPFFVAHGTQDKLIPFERSRQSVGILEQAGAQVSFCQSEVGHKVGADCLRALEAFFED